MIVHERSSWFKLILGFRGSTLQHTWKRILVTTAAAGAVTLAHVDHGPLIVELTPTPFSLVGLALGIFLGFRNNTSYDRFWEGRKLWGACVNTSRTFARQILTLVRSPEGGPADDVASFQRELIHAAIAYVHAFRMHLRDTWEPEALQSLLPQEALDQATAAINRPVAILQWMGHRVREAYDARWIHPMHLPVLEQSLTDFTDIQGGCERIKSTPIPYSYNVLLHRLVAAYCLALPFGLVHTIGPVTPAVVFFVSYAFFGLDAVGDEIENPFGLDENDLPLSAISRMIDINLRQALQESDVPELLKPVDSVLS